jgi:hypothetical protein
MNSYKKIAGNKKKKTMRKTLKITYISKRKHKKRTYNNKFRKRYQIGCSRKKVMKGGGIGLFQGLLDSVNIVSNAGSDMWNTYHGELPVASAIPTQP